MADFNTPSVVHPKLIKAGEYTFRVVSYSALTDDQAARVVLFYCRTHKLLKKHRKGVISIVTTFDEESSRLL